MQYNAIYEMSNGHQVVVCNIDHRPNLNAVTLIPDNTGRYGKVISIEKSNKNACLRSNKVY